MSVSMHMCGYMSNARVCAYVHAPVHAHAHVYADGHACHNVQAQIRETSAAAADTARWTDQVWLICTQCGTGMPYTDVN